MSWQSIRFEELYAEPSRNGVYKSKEFHGSGTKMVNMGELFGYEFISDQEMKRVQLTDAELKKSGLQEGDLLFGRRSLVEAGAGKCSLVTNIQEPTAFESSIIRVRLDKGEILPRFLYYWFRSPLGRGRVYAIVSGVNVKGIKGSDLKNIEVEFPDLPTQERIAGVLSAYDDLIENNRRRIAFLEKAARLLYREWFVHFRFPGSETTKFVDGLPEGWERRKVMEVSEYLSRGITPKYDPEAKCIVINQKCIRDNRVTLHLARKQSKLVPAVKHVRRLDVLVNSTGKGTLGRVAQFHAECSNLTVDSHVSIVRASEAVNPLWFGTTMIDKEALIETLGRGSTSQTELSKEDLGRMEITVPHISLQIQFGEKVAASRAQVEQLLLQNDKLAKARDLLLPRLMDGRLPIPE
ncbi:restriction endonuclease subunit S [Sulfitobacter sp. W074]|uniref:restriction endonuclease subunit S n=1 Tax=Sulfitobacter sp. W074 TaxID=2867026 RepID=UPI0021A6E178|nr:restriction endonuclease subunit S [Sulfitobacter sp. W074]UWR38614.1 restriction endonuclease subunit S [Sulfitobacter sp. W074]